MTPITKDMLIYLQRGTKVKSLENRGHREIGLVKDKIYTINRIYPTESLDGYLSLQEVPSPIYLSTRFTLDLEEK
jgi:hypothetical protein